MTVESITQNNSDSRLGEFAQYEVPRGVISKEHSSEYLLFTNGLQMVLALRHSKTESVSQWFENHSVDFRLVFETIIEKNPFYFDDSQTIGDISEEKWLEIESELYT